MVRGPLQLGSDRGWGATNQRKDCVRCRLVASAAGWGPTEAGPNRGQKHQPTQACIKSLKNKLVLDATLRPAAATAPTASTFALTPFPPAFRPTGASPEAATGSAWDALERALEAGRLGEPRQALWAALGHAAPDTPFTPGEAALVGIGSTVTNSPQTITPLDPCKELEHNCEFHVKCRDSHHETTKSSRFLRRRFTIIPLPRMKVPASHS